MVADSILRAYPTLVDIAEANHYGAQGDPTGVEEPPKPAKLRLSVAPNPFNALLRINVTTPISGRMHIAVYNQTGQLVRQLRDTHVPSAGVQTVLWDGKDGAARPVGSGVYLVRLTTPTAVVTERVTLLR